MTTSDLRYPIGPFESEREITPERRVELIQQIAEAPARLRSAVAGLSEEQLDTPYRPGGWSVRQVVHHLADSHLNAYVRLRLTLTEEKPQIKTYEEQLWAELSDARIAPVEVSLNLLDSLHMRWTMLLRAMTSAQYSRSFVHPVNGEMNMDMMLQLYAWHGRHHVAHVTALRERMGWLE